MTPREIVVVGTGGSGRETYLVARDIEQRSPGTWQVQGFVGNRDPDAEILERLSVPFLGDSAELVSRIPEAANWSFVVGIGDGPTRSRIEQDLLSQGLQLATLIHPSALVGPDVAIGAGSVVCANSVITTNVRLGTSTQVNIGCVIAHDARIGDHVTFAQSVNVAGNVTIHDDATIFTNASILPGMTIGAGAIVGAGAVVTKDVAPGVTVVGVPAKPLD